MTTVKSQTIIDLYNMSPCSFVYSFTLQNRAVVITSISISKIFFSYYLPVVSYDSEILLRTFAGTKNTVIWTVTTCMPEKVY
jgi:hypothetical protein